MDSTFQILTDTKHRQSIDGILLFVLQLVTDSTFFASFSHAEHIINAIQRWKVAIICYVKFVILPNKFFVVRYIVRYKRYLRDISPNTYVSKPAFRISDFY